MEENRKIFLSLKKEYMETKALDYLGYAVTNFIGKADSENSIRIFSKKEFSEFIKDNVNISRYKSKACFEALLAAGIIEQVGDDSYALGKVAPPFLKLLPDTIRYFFKHYHSEHLKVYCYLLNKYNMHEIYGWVSNYYFSIAELLRVIGYNDRNQKNNKFMYEILFELENNGFIKYNHERTSKAGCHGVYFELLYVSSYSPNSIKASKEVMEDNRVSGLPKMITVDGEEKEYNPKMLQPMPNLSYHMLPIFARSENKQLVRELLDAGMVPESGEEFCKRWCR